MLGTTRGPQRPDPLDGLELEMEHAQNLLKLADKVRVARGGMIALGGTLNMRQTAALRQLKLIDVMNAGAGDMALLTERGLAALPIAAQMVGATVSPSA